MTVFIKWRISTLAVGRRALDGVMIPAVLGGGVTPTCEYREILKDILKDILSKENTENYTEEIC